MVSSASRGPTDTPTLITDEGTLHETFGIPSSNHYGIYAAEQYLREGRNLWFVRVGLYDVTASGAILGGDGVANAVTFVASSSGSWANTYRIIVEADLGSGYRISVYDGLVLKERKTGVLVGTVNAASDRYIETQFANSLYVTFTDGGAYTSLLASTNLFSGGDDGAPVDDSDIVGTTVGNTSTGLQCFANAETIDVNMIACPGWWQRSVVGAMITLCESRGDCIALIDPPYGLTVQQVVDWHNGDLAGNVDYLTAAPNSSYAAVYWPWIQVYDGFNDAYVWIPPSGTAARIYTHTDAVTEPWFAPAGLVRGNPAGLLDLEHSPTLGERDYMYGRPGHCVNPFVNFATDGITLWGQKTMQRAPTALDRVNVRRMLLYARKVIATATRYLVFEPNDWVTWRRFRMLVEPFLNNIMSRRGLYDFRVVCDETTNTPYYIDQNVMRGKILMQPTKAAEIIEIEFTLLPTGASFDEF